MPTLPETTLRLIMPQRQGGNLPYYHFAAQMLAWLDPETAGPVETAPEPEPGERLVVEDGMLARAAVVRQAQAARRLIEKHRPDRVVTLCE